ncbi:MAG TPA: hypothetical protein VKU41_10645 [Polyangiaceae bacterium]|nr:hypothetical protein [Polyangiaceae bacterium]
MKPSLQHGGVTPALALLVAAYAAGCAPPLEHWSCDWDSSVGRPLSDPNAVADEAGALPSSVCANTCGPPVGSCMLTELDGGRRGAICPRCTF